MTGTERVPDAQAFLDARDQAHSAWLEARQAASAVVDYQARSRAFTDAGHAHTRAIQAAWEGLSNSSYALLSWLGENARGQIDEVTELLQALTPDMSLADLDQLADDSNWCYVYGDLRDAALGAGIASHNHPLLHLRTGDDVFPLVLHPDVQEFLDATRAADDAWVEARRARNADRAATTPQERYEDVQRTTAVHREAARAAWAKLGQSQQPVLVWVVANVASYTDEACDLFRAMYLHTKLADLDQLAIDQGWCDMWENLRNKALSDGVVNYTDPVLRADPTPKEDKTDG